MNDSNSATPPPTQRSQPPLVTRRQARDEQPKKRNSGMAWWLLGMMTGLVLIVEIPNEILSWRFAAALEARESGKKEEAEKVLAELLQKKPEDPRFLQAQYAWNYEDGKYEEALAYVQQLLDGRHEGTWRFVALQGIRADLYLHLKRYPEAIADCLDVARLQKTTGEPSREEVLNGIAYARALGGLDLDAALVDIDAAVAISRARLKDAEQGLQHAESRKKGTLDAKKELVKRQLTLLGCVDTRGLIHFKQEDYVAAETDFAEAVQMMQVVGEYFRLHKDILSAEELHYRDFAAKMRQRDRNDAVIYYHRSLNLTKLGREADAQRDWKKARDLIGKEPDDSLF